MNQPARWIVDPTVADSQSELMQTLHDVHAAHLWRYVLRRTGYDHALTQDVVQEALLRAWQHPEVLERSEDAARAWLFRVAQNLVVDEWRARSRHPETVTADLPEPTTYADDDATDRWLVSWVVTDALRQLSADHRQVLLECYYASRPVKEVAERLGIPEGTVKSRTHYALRALRLAIEERGGPW